MKKQPSPNEVNSLTLALIRKISREDLIIKSSAEVVQILTEFSKQFNPNMPDNLIAACVNYAMAKSLPEN